MMIRENKDGTYRIFPDNMMSYNWNFDEETKFRKEVLKLLKKKRLPKSLEISWLEHLLENIRELPEHEYNKKYDTYKNQHPLFF